MTTDPGGTPDTIAGRCTRARQRLGISQREVDRRLGRSDSGHCRRIEAGHRPNPATSTIVAIARALDVDLTWLATGEGSWRRRKPWPRS